MKSLNYALTVGCSGMAVSGVVGWDEAVVLPIISFSVGGTVLRFSP